MTTHTTPIDLRPYHGRECEAVLNSCVIGEFKAKGKISVNNYGEVFLCQNERDGGRADEMFGFSYSWRIQENTELVWDKNHLKSITILDEPKSINPEWDWKDGEEVCHINNPIGRWRIVLNGNIIHVFSFDGISVCSGNNDGVFNSGYRKLPPPPRKLVEITEEVFRSTAWYGKKVIWADKERKIIAVDYETNNLHFGLNRQSHYSQCKLIEE